MKKDQSARKICNRRSLYNEIALNWIRLRRRANKRAAYRRSKIRIILLERINYFASRVVSIFAYLVTLIRVQVLRVTVLTARWRLAHSRACFDAPLQDLSLSLLSLLFFRLSPSFHLGPYTLFVFLSSTFFSPIAYSLVLLLSLSFRPFLALFLSPHWYLKFFTSAMKGGNGIKWKKKKKGNTWTWTVPARNRRDATVVVVFTSDVSCVRYFWCRVLLKLWTTIFSSEANDISESKQLIYWRQ